MSTTKIVFLWRGTDASLQRISSVRVNTSTVNVHYSIKPWSLSTDPSTANLPTIAILRAYKQVVSLTVRKWDTPLE
ncbi:hypothetical protein HZH66_006563 [Vespula vulgaris]|uniref:Uncharacterized protein n=1 Tax=Vespula vulgaris TaxID=7454 RepID=A0A834K3S8_VESVU|nr:hypothetical protein HZH66_006563 [Vespula vulgaris]